MKKMFFIIRRAVIVSAVLVYVIAAAGCAGPERGWSIDSGDTETLPGSEEVFGSGVSGTADASGIPEAPEMPEAPVIEMITVHVCGAVMSPGVYELPAGSRLADAVEAAGGFREDAAQDHENLASELSDAQKIVILTDEEAETDPYGLSSVAGVPAAHEGGTNSGNPNIPELININTADAALLQTLPGIGRVKAEAIIAYRRTHGAFSSEEEIQNVSGIGAATWEEIRDLITV